MNNSFLEFVAKDLIAKYGNNLSQIAVVFPNKRASIFLNEYLVRLVDKPLWSPAYITISDLFRKHSQLIVGDPIQLNCILYKIYAKHTGSLETLDHFYGWGQILLSDFDDIDKNMADARKVFANLRDIHEFDDTSYLSEEQKALLQRFFSTFSDNHDSELRQRFLKLWSHFHDIYVDYNQELEHQGIAYEGALYRRVAESEELDFEYDKYIFVGFNMLHQVEQVLFERLMKQKKAAFYWDFDTSYLQTDGHEAGHFIKKYLSKFPNEFDNKDQDIYDCFRKTKQITYISSPTENLQARYISHWLQENGRIKAGRDTAIILCDENLLQTAIHCLPSQVDSVNITTGYPLSQSPFSSLINILITLQTAGLYKHQDKYRLFYVNKVLNHPYTRYISADYVKVKQSLKEQKQFYPSREFLSIDEGLALLFKDISTEDNTLFTERLSQWLIDILQKIAENSQDVADPFFHESLFKSYTLMTRLHELILSGDLEVDLSTFQRLVNQLTSSTSIPFHGEPATGIQIMGVLETRNLDFEHVLILSCNEGNMPKGINDTSFIPHSIRKAYDLTTIDHKVSIYSYYFNSLVQRAKDVTILYNNSTEDGHTGEMSRFMLQLMIESPHAIRKETLRTGIQPIHATRITIIKDANILDKLNEIQKLSPTAINQYIKCPLQFYYMRIAGIEEPDMTDEEDVDNRIFGNIFHRSAELIYKRLWVDKKEITKDSIQEFLKHPEQLQMIVDQAFREELFGIRNNAYLPEYNGLQLINREVIIRYLRQLLKIDARHSHFNIMGLELYVSENITIETSQGKRTVQVGGIIDRLDMIHDEQGNKRIRVLDYKTGKVPRSATQSIDELFSNENMSKKHTDYFFQTMLYSIIVANSENINPSHIPVSPALLFIQQSGGENYDPILSINKEKIEDAKQYEAEFREKLQNVITEIFEPQEPFKPTDNKDICGNCIYKQLCNM